MLTGYLFKLLAFIFNRQFKMADKIDVNDRRGLKRQTADEKSDHVDAEERLYKLPRCENFEKDQGKQWESCTTEVNHQNLGSVVKYSMRSFRCIENWCSRIAC
jgi:hypothetical protein